MLGYSRAPITGSWRMISNTSACSKRRSLRIRTRQNPSVWPGLNCTWRADLPRKSSSAMAVASAVWMPVRIHYNARLIHGPMMHKNMYLQSILIFMLRLIFIFFQFNSSHNCLSVTCTVSQPLSCCCLHLAILIKVIL